MEAKKREMVPDGVLLLALADAADGKGVLVLTATQSETSKSVMRGVELVQLRAKELGADFIKQMRQLSSSWHLNIGNGWIFFFPEDDLDPLEDVSNPHVVYCLVKDTWKCQEYPEWVQSRTKSKKTLNPGVWARPRNED